MAMPLNYPRSFGIRLSEKDADALTALAKKKGVSVGVLLRRMILEDLKKEGGSDVR